VLWRGPSRRKLEQALRKRLEISGACGVVRQRLEWSNAAFRSFAFIGIHSWLLCHYSRPLAVVALLPVFGVNYNSHRTIVG
jgi:hypothetical protein